MKATPKAIIAAFDLIKQQLLDCNLLADWNPSVIERLSKGVNRVTWATVGTRPELTDISNSSVQEYLLFLEGRHFQFRLVDGSFFQLSYDVKSQNDEISQSRLVWYPCPVAFSPEELEIASLSEIIQTSPINTLALQAPLRFDFAPNQEADNHSSTHLHLGKEDFRLPVQRALEPSRFVRFIIRSAYPHAWKEFPCFREAEDWGFADKLQEDDKLVGAISWQLPIALKAKAGEK